MKRKRSSGILMHISSLPGKFGIGDLGPAAYDFLDFLEASGHQVWQLLPVNPTDQVYSHSPYSSHSAFAGNPLLISPEILQQEGFLTADQLDYKSVGSPDKVDFKKVVKHKYRLLDLALASFRRNQHQLQEFEKFRTENAHWLDTFALYQALREEYKQVNWTEWPKALRERESRALQKAEEGLSDQIEREKFFQFLFFSQWEKLAKAARDREIRLLGDVPFYVNHDSADCWQHSHLFKLDKDKNPAYLSGVPPDLFSKTGQLWGTPVYDWKALSRQDFDWWIKRLQQNLKLFDLVRLDHFRAFSAYWEVPAGEKTAEKGKWVASPGKTFFRSLQKVEPEMPFIAEDLGLIDQDVYDLVEQFGFPKMKVLQFAFGDDYQDNPYLPFNHSGEDVVYTGTHDNNTSRGWYEQSDTCVRRHLSQYSGSRVTSENVHKVLHRLSLFSVGFLAITPMQDILGLGKEALMNVPGSTKGNWTWRMTASQRPDSSLIRHLLKLNRLSGRIGN